MSKLAILGGTPVRKKPFHSSVVIDEHERTYLMEVLKVKEFSRFMGSPSCDIEKILLMPSNELERYKGQYFSFLGGRMVRKFEANFARKFNVPFAISLNSATSGLASALGSLGIGPGDEVITTPLSFSATALSILFFNSIPVFADVENRTFCLDPLKIEHAITRRTKAILVVHLLGNAADMDAIMKIAKKFNLSVIEDCAQAAGTKYKGKYVGTIGDIGVFSFQETKNMTTGEGGMIITGQQSLARKARLIRNHGESIPNDAWNENDLVNIVGMNFRMTELTAAMGIAQLAKLNSNNRIRKKNTHFLAKELDGLPGLEVVTPQNGIVPHIFSMIYDEQKTDVERKKMLVALRAEGIPVGSGYLRTIYENPIFLKKIAYGRKHCPWSCHLYDVKRKYKVGDCPVAETLLKEKFIWFYHINRPNGISDMRDVVEAFKKVFENLEFLKRYEIKSEMGYKW